MATIARTAASLRFFGENLNPEDLTRMLGSAPTKSARKGDVRGGPSGYVEKTGSWRLHAPDQSPGNLDEQIKNILAALTSDLAVWGQLSRQFKVDMFCGAFMDQPNEGLELHADTLSAMGVRGIALSLDIYDPVQD